MKRRQQGFNLISLMVGMTLSLISILAMLTLYKNLVGVSVSSIQGSRQDGQIAAAMLTVQNELRNAGFWIDSTTTSLQLLQGAAFTSTSTTYPKTGTLSATTRVTPSGSEQTGNALVWIYKTSSTASMSCAGLLVQQDQSDSTLPVRLFRLQGPTGCTSLSQASGWTATLLIERGQPLDFFKVMKTTCWPFGKIAENPSGLQVSIMATTSTVTSQTAVPYASICLPNIT